jgi:6-phosphogluconolactonase
VSANWKSYPSVDATAEACAVHILSVLDAALQGGGEATIAVSGGSTPKRMFPHLAKGGVDWTRVHIFWVDERCVPPTHEDSNYRMAEEHLIRPAHVPHRNVHRIKAELAPEVAAKNYSAEIRECFSLDDGELPHFDLVHLGIGPDAHTASLFPGESLIDDREKLVAAVRVEKFRQHRITLLPGVLLAARHAAVLACGDDKAEALRHVIRDPYDPIQFPGQIVAHHARRASWFLDSGAASQLT